MVNYLIQCLTSVLKPCLPCPEYKILPKQTPTVFGPTVNDMEFIAPSTLKGRIPRDITITKIRP